MKPKFVAVLVDIKELDKLPEGLRRYADFKAAVEGRNTTGNEKVVIFNIASTSSYVSVFLDKGKTLGDIENELGEVSASLNPRSRTILKKVLL